MRLQPRVKREQPYYYYIWPFEIEEEGRFCVARGAASLLWLKLPSMIEYPGFQYDFYIEGPRDFEITDPSGRTAGVGFATNVPKLSRDISTSGRVRYHLSFKGKKQDVRFDQWGPASGNLWCPIIYKINKTQETGFVFWGETGDGYQYPARNIKVSVLPWKAGRQPKRTKIDIEFVSAMLLSPEELSALVGTYAKAGVNMVNQNSYWWDAVPSVDI